MFSEIKMVKLSVNNFPEIRLDRFLRKNFTYLTQGVIEKCLRKNQIKINNQKAKSNNKISNGDVVNIANYLIKPFVLSFTLKKISPDIILLAKKILNEYLLFSCNEFIAINKPHGLATQGGSKLSISIDHALQYFNRTEKTDYKLIHRLDKDTSGILIIAKNLNTAFLLGKAFKEKKIRKTYLAILTGRSFFLPKEGIITSYIAKKKYGNHNLVEETKDGKFAKTIYKILASKKNRTIIKYAPITGRTHQLRYHSKQLGLPILGDTKYGEENFKRMMLHASEIIIPEKIFGMLYKLRAPLDKNFKFVIEKIDCTLDITDIS